MSSTKHATVLLYAMWTLFIVASSLMAFGVLPFTAASGIFTILWFLVAVFLFITGHYSRWIAGADIPKGAEFERHTDDNLMYPVKKKEGTKK